MSRPRWLLALAVCAGMLLVDPPPPMAAPVSGPAAPGVRATLTTANVKASLSSAQARADIRRATTGASAVLLQEMWPRAVSRLTPAGWGSWHPSRPVAGCRDHAVLWQRDTWRLGTHYGVRLHSAGGVGNCAAVAVLVHRRTGLRLPLVGVHMLPGVEVAGRPRPRPIRVARYHRALDVVQARALAIRDRRGLVVLGGDWNVDWPADHRVASRPFPSRHLRPSFDSNWGRLPWTRPTHGHRRIDTWWWSETRGLWALDSDTLRGTWSDHNFVRVTLRLPVTGTTAGR